MSKRPNLGYTLPIQKTPMPTQKPNTKHTTTSIIAAVSLALSLCITPYANAAKQLAFEVLKTLPHNSTTFTQGLLVGGDQLIESSGLYGKSFIASYNKETGEQTYKIPLPKRVFAEGLTRIDDTLYLLTWKENKLLRFNATTREALTPLSYEGEGWGLTHTDNLFLMTDGSEHLYLRSQKDFRVLKKVKVHDQNKIYRFLNELEYAQGHLWLNVWQTNQILRVNYHTGEVTGILDLTSLQKQNGGNPKQAVLNGIAYDPEHNAYWVTGKYWPKRYLIKISTPVTQ